MKAKEFIPASKPRNPVVRQQQTSGAGAHRDKKKEQKQGYEKHKGQGVAEVSKSTIDRYVAKASDAHGHADFAARMSKDDPTLRSYHKDQKRTAEKRRQGISRALDRMSKNVDEGWGQREFEIGGYTYMTEIDEEEDNRKIFHMIKTPDGKTVDVDFTPYAYMNKEDVKLYIKLGMPKRQGIGPLDSEKLQKMAQIKGIAMLDREMARAGLKDESMSERVRDPEDWDEGNTEPPNNFAVYINGKKWKVFQGRGQFADDYKEMQHYRQLQNWALAKSQATGKKWEVYKTGESPTA